MNGLPIPGYRLHIKVERMKTDENGKPLVNTDKNEIETEIIDSIDDYIYSFELGYIVEDEEK